MTTAPSLAEQRRIMGLTVDYVTHAIQQLPHFYATRAVTHFESAVAQGDAVPADFGALQGVRIARATVQYRDGEEVVAAAAMKAGKGSDADQGLHTWGVFGPILSLVMLDAARNQLAWSHWDQGPNGSLAVFRYAVPREKSHYEVRYCCVVSSYSTESETFQRMSGYHGEIGVDPATGNILRLELVADLQPSDPMSRADLMVEYGRVELGGRSYICPAKSVSISVARTVRMTQDATGRRYPALGPPQMLLNHADFDQYHLFRGETRVLTANEERSAGIAPDATLPAPQAADAQASDEVLAETPPASAAAGDDDNAEEITAAKATSLPDRPAHAEDQAAAQQPSGYTLRVNARLVDVNVVALDKKRHPITGLSRDDFEVYDNGVKQEIRSFSQTDVESTIESGGSHDAQMVDEQTFSNRANAEMSDKAAAGSGGNTLVFLVDPANLADNDLADARRQILEFLKQAAPTERVALYVMRYRGFEVLEEATTDHARVATRLAKWMPTAQDLLNARDEQDRNRQKIETVHSPEDLPNVSGGLTPESQPNALDVLADIARHLAAMAGQKSLVWATSDHALADWNPMSVANEKHAEVIEAAALHTQEAMNNAHVSLYPLEASRLDPNMVNAETGNRSVPLTPAYQTSRAMEDASAGAGVQSGIDSNKSGQNTDLRPGQLTSQMQQNMRPMEGVFREVAEATGGRAIRRSSDMKSELNAVVAETRATYLLGISPAGAADGKYHVLTVKLAGHKDATLRYRTGYEYDKEPTTLKERFEQAVWQPSDAKEIALTARPVTDAAGEALRVTIAATDLDLTEQTPGSDASAPTDDAGQASASAGRRELWSGKVDIFLVQRDETGRNAHVTGQTIGLHLKPDTYQHAITEGLTFDQRVEAQQPGVASLRVVVVDVNSGRIGSVTVPGSALALKTN